MPDTRRSVCCVSGLKGNRVRISNSPAAVCASYCFSPRAMSKPYPLEVLCLWEGWQGDKVHESEDLQHSFKCFEESYKCGSLRLEFIPQRGCPLF